MVFHYVEILRVEPMIICILAAAALVSTVIGRAVCQPRWSSWPRDAVETA